MTVGLLRFVQGLQNEETIRMTRNKLCNIRHTHYVEEIITRERHRPVISSELFTSIKLVFIVLITLVKYTYILNYNYLLKQVKQAFYNHNECFSNLKYSFMYINIYTS